jgi:nucleoside-diphosphate-sugar epimerase
MTRTGEHAGDIVAVTGATGFLGRALVARLLEAGDEVIALARPGTDRSRLAAHPRLRWISYGDLAADDVTCELAALSPTTFVHLGWAGVSNTGRGDVDHVRTNVPTTISSVRLAATIGCNYWLGVGSQAEYGPTDAVIREDDELRPTTDYGLAKVAAAAAAHATGAALGRATGWARVFSIYGPGDHEGAVLPYAIRELLAGRAPQLGACTHDWDLLHVDDAADAFRALVRARAAGATNVASGEQRALRDAIDIAATEIDGPESPAYGDHPGTPLRASIDRITSTTGWRPLISLEAGVAATVEHARHADDILVTGAAT